MNFYEELLSNKKGSGTLPPVTAPGLLNAIVKDIWDEQHKGMIKVEYLLGEKNHKTSDWVRVMTPYGGNDFGNYWLPEIGSEVLVGFINGNLNMPVVLGCLWNGKDQHPQNTVNKENDTKTIMTKGGNKITFSDVKQKEKIIIETPKKLEITVDDEKDLISVSDKEKQNRMELDCKGGKATLTAKTSIELQIGSKVVFKADANSIEMKSGTVQVDAQQSLKLSGQSTNVSGASIKVKANGDLGLESSGMTQVKGSMVKIN